MEKVWAQAYSLFKTGFRYWFIDEEIDELNKRNSEFSMVSMEEDLIKYYFSPISPNMNSSLIKFYPPAIIQSKLEKYSNLRLSAKKIGEALAKIGILKIQKTIDKQVSWVYPVYEKTLQEIEQQFVVEQKLTFESI
jgi:predicted P-loop ATPase